MEDIKSRLTDKIPYEEYIKLFENLKDITEGEKAGLDVNFSGYKIGNTTISTGSNWVDFDFILKYKKTWFAWVRGFTYVFFIVYNINQFLKLLRGFNLADGSAKSSDVIPGQTSIFKK